MDAAHEAERQKKAAADAAKYALTKDMAQEACLMMKNMVLVAREIHDAEKGTDRQGIYDLVKVTCPALKKKFGHAAKAMEVRVVTSVYTCTEPALPSYLIPPTPLSPLLYDLSHNVFSDHFFSLFLFWDLIIIHFSHTTPVLELRQSSTEH